MSRPPVAPPTYACRTCLDGLGWVRPTDEGRGAVKPCPACRAATHALWVGGHFDLNHHCDDCRNRHRGRAA
jgi:hypothetical protein